MTRETFVVTKKTIRNSEHLRIAESYYDYIMENKNHTFKRKSFEGTKLFDLLRNNTVGKRRENEIRIDGSFKNNNLLFISNFRVVGK